MGTFVREYVDFSRIPNNKLGSDHIDLRYTIKPELLEKVRKMRNDYQSKYTELYNKLHAIGCNKRIKNKLASFEDLAEKERCWFNYRSLDFFLYRLGYAAHNNWTYKEGIEQELDKLFSETTNVLILYNKYHGYNSIYWWDCHAFDLWRAAGEPDFPEKDDYLREYLGVLLH